MLEERAKKGAIAETVEFTYERFIILCENHDKLKSILDATTKICLTIKEFPLLCVMKDYAQLTGKDLDELDACLMQIKNLLNPTPLCGVSSEACPHCRGAAAT